VTSLPLITLTGEGGARARLPSLSVEAESSLYSFPAMKIHRAFQGPAVLLLCSGCLSGAFEYTPPTAAPGQPVNSVTVTRSLDSVWKDLVPALGMRFFVINNLDRASGLINVSYSGSPESYIDCGHIESWVDNLRGKRTYAMPGASSQAYEFKGSDGALYYAERKLNLEGRINIIPESLETDQTRVTANTRYVVTRNLMARRIDLAVPNTTTDTIAFNSGQRTEFPKRGTTAPLTCQPTGKLESAVLELVK
jgi:hypothetical protein